MLRYTVVFLGIACLLGCGTAPVQEMSDARQAIAAARAAGATERASPDLYAADAAIARAESHLQAQEFTRARLAALQAKRHATSALAGILHPAAPDAAPAGKPAPDPSAPARPR